jgi:flagellar basal-body rod protein FlgC
MSFFDAINIAASGLTAERTQMDVTAENLANAQTTNGPNGQPYQPQAVVLQSVGNDFNSELASAMGGGSSIGSPTPGGVQVTGIVSENVPPQLVYDPGNPEANAQGYVKMPNIQPVTEMTNLISESNAYQADVTAMQTAKSMYTATLNLLK